MSDRVIRVEVNDDNLMEMFRLHWVPIANDITKEVVDVCYPQELVDGIMAFMGAKGLMAASRTEDVIRDKIREQLAMAFLHGARLGMSEIVARLVEAGKDEVTLQWEPSGG